MLTLRFSLFVLGLVTANNVSATDLIYKNAFENTALVSGLVSGISSTELILNLQSNGVDESLSITQNGTFVFNNYIAVGEQWQVLIQQLPNSPSQQNCAMSGSSGIMTGSGIDSVVISYNANAWNWDEMNWDEGGWN